MKREQGMTIGTITGEGVIVDFEHFDNVDQAKERCRKNLNENCLIDMKPCDLRAAGTCHQGSPCIIAKKFSGRP